jgi:hypothetical protein
MIATCVDGSNESARKGCNSLVGREWKGGPLENLGGSGSGSCALLKTRSFGVRGSCRKSAAKKRGCGRQMETTRKGEKVKDAHVGQ